MVRRAGQRDARFYRAIGRAWQHVGGVNFRTLIDGERFYRCVESNQFWYSVESEHAGVALCRSPIFTLNALNENITYCKYDDKKISTAYLGISSMSIFVSSGNISWYSFTSRLGLGGMRRNIH